MVDMKNMNLAPFSPYSRGPVINFGPKDRITLAGTISINRSRFINT
jgi:hypothetical protein